MKTRASETALHLVLGPALLVAASLIDLFLATRVFVHPDRLVGALSFFVFGALSGLPCQLALARTRAARWLQGPSPSPDDVGPKHRKAARVAGGLAAASTATWLYALGGTAPALIFPLSNLSPVLFAIADSLQGRLRWFAGVGSAVLLASGLWIFRSPNLGAFAVLTPVVVAALCIRNLASAGSEVAERNATPGAIVHFNALRFVWLVIVGVPLALGFLIATSRLNESLELILRSFPLALPLHMLTMLLSFGGSFFRTRAKGLYSLTLCSTASATPLVLTPLTAMAANSVIGGLFPTTAGSAHGVMGSLLVVSAVVWLVVFHDRNRNDPPPQPVRNF